MYVLSRLARRLTHRSAAAVIIIGLAALAACTETGGGATGAGGAMGAGGAATSAIAGSTGEGGFLVLMPDGGDPNGCPDVPPPPAPPTPVVACDAADGGVCDIPPSQCADDRFLAYWDNGACADAGACSYDVYVIDCGCGPTGCSNGGCTFLGTAPAPP